MERKDQHTRRSDLNFCNIDMAKQMEILMRLINQSSGILYPSLSQW